jgi:hypothetical protein
MVKGSLPARDGVGVVSPSGAFLPLGQHLLQVAVDGFSAFGGEVPVDGAVQTVP